MENVQHQRKLDSMWELYDVLYEKLKKERLNAGAIGYLAVASLGAVELASITSRYSPEVQPFFAIPGLLALIGIIAARKPARTYNRLRQQKKDIYSI